MQGDAIAQSRDGVQDAVPVTVYGNVAVEKPGPYDPAIQQFILQNTSEGAGWIPGSSPYIASKPPATGLARSTTASPPSVTARCGNMDLDCKAGINQPQPPLLPELTDAMRSAIAEGAAQTSRQVGVIASGATAAAAAGSPQVKPIAGAVAVGATAIGVVADVVEQVMRPDMNQVFRDQLLLGVPANVLTQRYPLYAPVINAIKESLP